MANGDIHKLGTLYVNNVKRPFPTKPWRTDSTPTGAPSVGNILDYYSVNGNIEIRDTDVDDAYKLRWVEVTDGDKKLLISDRCLLAKVTWDNLNAQGLVNGKEITIDGQRYKIRLLSGGTNYRSVTDPYSGGTPTTNEWDRIITNESSFAGLPKPTSTDLDKSLDSSDYNGVHNNIWHWYDMYSWCQEVYSGGSDHRVVRGRNSAHSFSHSTSSNISGIRGWRPVLEVPNSIPTISINDEELGGQLSSISKTYNVIDKDCDTFTLTEKLDGTPIRTLENQISGTEYTLDLSQQWDSLSYGNHTIEIIATDSNSLSSTVTITFDKIKEITKPIPTTSSLKELVDHIGNVDKDIDYLRDKLSDNLNSKGVECSSQDKMSSLIDMVNNIDSANNVIAGTTFQLFNYKLSTDIAMTQNAVLEFSSNVKGSVKLQINYICSASGSSSSVNIDLIRDGSIVSSKTFELNAYGSYITIEYDLAQIQLNDTIKIYAPTGSKNISIRGNGGILVTYDKV